MSEVNPYHKDQLDATEREMRSRGELQNDPDCATLGMGHNFLNNGSCLRCGAKANDPESGPLGVDHGGVAEELVEAADAGSVTIRIGKKLLTEEDADKLDTIALWIESHLRNRYLASQSEAKVDYLRQLAREAREGETR